MKTNSCIRRSSLLLAATLLPLLASCTATGKFKYAGMPPEWDTQLPAPEEDEAVPGTMRIRLQCPTFQESEELTQELTDALRAQMKKAGLGEVSILKDRTRRSQYEIVVYEAGENGKFDFNEEGAVWGALGAGVATGALTQDLGLGLGAAAVGAGLFGLVTSEKKDKYGFARVCYQRTSAVAVKTAQDRKSKDTRTSASMTDADTGTRVSAHEGTSILEEASWSYETRQREMPFLFYIQVSGGTLSTKATRDEAMREIFVKNFPRYITGGTVID